MSERWPTMPSKGAHAHSVWSRACSKSLIRMVTTMRAFRMVFDQSPYPSPETWQLHDQTYAMDVAEWKEFHSGDLGTHYDKSWFGDNCTVM